MILSALKPVGLIRRIYANLKELRLFVFLIYSILSFVMGRGVLFGYMFPFAMAFFVVLITTKKSYSIFSLPIILGIISCKVPEYILVKYLIAMCVLLIFSLLLNHKLSKAPLIMAAYSSAVFGGTIAVYQFFLGVILLYDIFLIITESAATFSFIYLFSKLPDLLEKNIFEHELTAEEIIAASSALIIAVISLGDITLLGLSLKYILSILIILISASEGGINSGGAVGIILGMIITMTSFGTAETIGMFGMGGIAAGFFRKSNRIVNCISWVISIIVFMFYFDGLSDPYIIIPESLVSCGLFLMIPKKKMNILGEKMDNSLKHHHVNYFYGDKIRKLIINNLRNYSDTFESLAITYNKAYERKQAVEEEDRQEIIISIRNRICGSCNFEKICWKKDNTKTRNIMKDIIYRVYKGLKVEEKYVRRELGFNCPNLDKIIFYVQSIIQVFGISYKWQKKLQGSRDITASQFRGIAKSINHLIEEINEEQLFNVDLEQKLYLKLKGLNLHIKNVNVIEGEHSKNITLEINESDIEFHHQKIETVVSEELGEDYHITRYKQTGKGEKKRNSILLRKVPRLKITTGSSKYAKEMNACGDSYICMDLKENEYLIALSDGMGSGEKAARESIITINTLKHLLEAGFEKELALKTMNSMLLLKSAEEIFSTVDITIINLDTGDTSFYKIGAAAAFIKRKSGKIEIIKYSTLPIGIMDQIKIEEIEVGLEAGDMIIMVSDGILDACTEGDKIEWMKSILMQMASKDPQTVSDLILNNALNRYKTSEKDDMTAITALLH